MEFTTIIWLIVLGIIGYSVYCTYVSWHNNGDRGTFCPVIAAAFPVTSGPVLHLTKPGSVEYFYGDPVLRALCGASGRELVTSETLPTSPYELMVVTVPCSEDTLRQACFQSHLVVVSGSLKIKEMPGVFVKVFKKYVPSPLILSRSPVILEV